MCGLFGIIRPTGIASPDTSDFARIGDFLIHRGPDGSGYIRDQQYLLGMHRLSIMDVTHGWQPFWSEDGLIGVLGNGEIYNAASLRHQLIDRDHKFSSRSDIEVVPHLYEEFGLDFVSHLRGMFALVIVDRSNDQILLVRDRMGEKPLFVYSNHGAIYFASEQTALVRSGVVRVDIHDQLLPSFLLHGYTTEPASLLSGVTKIPAAHMAIVSLAAGDMRLQCYWNPRDYFGSSNLSNERLAGALKKSIAQTCTSDVPVGIALSGGLDSSMIAAIAARERVDLHAFSIGYEGSGFDETQQAAALAGSLGIPIHITRLSTSDVARDFAEVCSIRDEPITDIAGPSLAALPRAAREAHVPVLLTGVGGDELFWGYEWIRRLAQWSTNYLANSAATTKGGLEVLKSRPTTLQGLSDWVLSAGGRRMHRDLKRFVMQCQSSAGLPLPFYEFQHGYRYIGESISRLTSGSHTVRPEFHFAGEPGAVPAMYTVMSNETYLKVNSLVQMDRLAMHYSIETRTPFADSDLVELILGSSIGSSDLFAGPKYRLRQVAPDFLPADVIARPKRGFTPPVREWLRAIWLANRDACQGEAIQQFTDLNATEVRRILRKPLTAIGQVDQMALRLLTLELWLRGLDSASPRTVTAP